MPMFLHTATGGGVASAAVDPTFGTGAGPFYTGTAPGAPVAAAPQAASTAAGATAASGDVMKVLGTVGQAIGAAQEASAQRAIAEANAELRLREAERERQIGELNARRARDDAKRLAATQRAILSARGGDVGSGSALLAQEDAAFEGEYNARLAEVNAQTMEAARRGEASIIRQEGDAKSQASIFRAGTTLLKGFQSFG